MTTLDVNPDCEPDILWDLDKLPYAPLRDGYYDEIHAYEVLEHCGAQGDFRFFFAQFSEFWRILKNGGSLCATVPDVGSVWAWGDPGHRRVIQVESLIFLDQAEYAKQVGHTPMSDYRYWYKADFKVDFTFKEGRTFYFRLVARK